ncbi:hypothetical protein Abr02nite_37570 [Paractinoplanes brasiliensis]|nr:hypothetical protein Abr02nite_37570 [Actinoplanes brasiliensis]
MDVLLDQVGHLRVRAGHRDAGPAADQPDPGPQVGVDLELPPVRRSGIDGLRGFGEISVETIGLMGYVSARPGLKALPCTGVLPRVLQVLDHLRDLARRPGLRGRIGR